MGSGSILLSEVLYFSGVKSGRTGKAHKQGIYSREMGQRFGFDTPFDTPLTGKAAPGGDIESFFINVSYGRYRSSVHSDRNKLSAASVIIWEKKKAVPLRSTTPFL